MHIFIINSSNYHSHFVKGVVYISRPMIQGIHTDLYKNTTMNLIKFSSLRRLKMPMSRSFSVYHPFGWHTSDDDNKLRATTICCVRKVFYSFI